MSKKIIALVLSLVIVASIPIEVFAIIPKDSSMQFNDDNIVLQAQVNNEENKDEYSDIVELYIKPYSDSAELYFKQSIMSLRIEEYNLLLGKWVELEYSNQGKYFSLDNLQPNTYHIIKVYFGDKFNGLYTFYTKPSNIRKVQNEVSKSNVILEWSNPNNLVTEIYRREIEVEELEEADTDAKEADEESEETEPEKVIVKTGKWELLRRKRGSKYKDATVNPDTYYQYRIRYICRNNNGEEYSDYKQFEDIYVPFEINNILEANGYIIVRQNDPLNKTIPYPYYKENDNRTIGSSGCGVCSSLMVIRNLTNYAPTLEAYTNELLKIGAREPYGSNMFKIASYMKNKYHLNYTVTKDEQKLKAAIKSGKMAVAHVGQNRLFAVTGGHFVAVVGVVKGKGGEDMAIVLDPYFSVSKYNDKRRKEAGIRYSNNGIVTCPFSALKEDGRGEMFTIFSK
ncbi:MAG: hypothetical protein IJS03_08715 [Eubacterium sp.]|nr:hypothetical protein [Eubacterium sp.]